MRGLKKNLNHLEINVQVTPNLVLHLSLRDFLSSYSISLGWDSSPFRAFKPFAQNDGFTWRASLSWKTSTTSNFKLETRNSKLTCDIPPNHFFKLRGLQYFYFPTFRFDEAFVFKIR